MKKVLLGLTVSLTLTVAHGQTAVYHPFPDSNAVWTETKYWLSGQCVIHDNYSLFFNGDTIIAGDIYKKIYATGNIYSSNCSGSPVSYSNDYKGALRVDNPQKKVYFNGYLLYDFNLNMGDTLPYSYNDGQTNKVIVVDSVLVGNNYHKRFLLDYVWGGPPVDTTNCLIEGVGSGKGLFQSLIPFIESGSQLFSFCFDWQAYYPSTITFCAMNVGITETNKQENKISVLPNPFSTQTVLQTDIPLHNATLTVYNCFGQTVAQIKNINGQAVTLFRDNLPSGLYFLRLTEANKIYTDKLVITD